jgi:UDP-N-acetylglucosamine 2-epimerase
VDAGWNRLAGHQQSRIVHSNAAAMKPKGDRPELYGDGNAATRIATILCGDAG